MFVHMIAGHLTQRLKGELLYSFFEFPERPGAFVEFLNTLGGQWNIIPCSIIAIMANAYGRVLVGLQRL